MGKQKAKILTFCVLAAIVSGMLTPAVCTAEDFLCFAINRVKIGTKANKQGNEVDIKGTFDPASPIDLSADDVEYIIDDGQGHTLTFFIPAGSFEVDDKPDKHKFKFDSAKGSKPDIQARFDFLKCEFGIKVSKLSDTYEITGDSLTIVLTAGANVGEEVVQVQLKPNHLEYKRKPKLDCCEEPDDGPGDIFEEVPGWRMPELAVTSLSVEPERADPCDLITFSAIVSDIGLGKTEPATIVFLVDDEEIKRMPVDSLVPGEEVEFTATWTAQGPGRHVVTARVEIEDGDFDGNGSNNIQCALARVSGEADPVLELRSADVDFDSLPLIPGEECEIPIKIQNPSFVDAWDVPVISYVDGEVVSSEIIEYLPSGGEYPLQIPWSEVTTGEHMIVADVCLISNPDFDVPSLLLGWYVPIPGPTVLNYEKEKDKWVSLGPRKLTNGEVGRICCFAFNPDDPDIMYAGGYCPNLGPMSGCGLWKTYNGGVNWWYPIGDKLPSMQVTSVAIDPMHPYNIVYFGTVEKGGIFKSVDGGINWCRFIDGNTMGGTVEGKGVIELAVFIDKYQDPWGVLIYAATEDGIYRYRGNEHDAEYSSPSEWDKIFSVDEITNNGFVRDIAFVPDGVYGSNGIFIYATIQDDDKSHGNLGNGGMWRCDKGPWAADNNDWEEIGTDLPSKGGRVIDISKSQPGWVYAGIQVPREGIYFGIYRSKNRGETSSWKPMKEYPEGYFHYSIYNPYIRVHPSEPDIVYFGGQLLYKFDGNISDTNAIYAWDMKALEFHPDKPNIYYSANDQGIFECEYIQNEKDKRTARNNNLRVTLLYDFDISRTDPDLMIGGTQDTGTILYEGKPEWRMIREGDGLFSLINPHDNNIMYSQNQSLGWVDPTKRSADGGKTWPDSFPAEPVGKGFTNAYITADTGSSDTVLAVADGKNILYTDDGGKEWKKDALAFRPNIEGTVRRVIVDPRNHGWIAGTSRGYIFYRTPERVWHQVFDHNDKAYVESLAVGADSKTFFATFGGFQSSERIWRFKIKTFEPFAVEPYNITRNFPRNLTPLVICRDGYRNDVAYVGTEKGVFRWEDNLAWMSWWPYNDGFPLTVVMDLLLAPNKELRAATKGRGAWTVITNASGSTAATAEVTVPHDQGNGVKEPEAKKPKRVKKPKKVK